MKATRRYGNSRHEQGQREVRRGRDPKQGDRLEQDTYRLDDLAGERDGEPHVEKALGDVRPHDGHRQVEQVREHVEHPAFDA